MDDQTTSGKETWASLAVGTVVLGTFFLWAYWPTLLALISKWENEPDYSHGYFVVPLALYFLWARRDRFPGAPRGLAWPGLSLIVLGIAIRVWSGLYYLEAIDAWSIPFWVAGVVWLFGGWKIFCWSLPSIGFLWFMLPLPWRIERWLSLPLQRIATYISSWSLQALGQPAIAEGNTILLGENSLEIAEACSGLRIFMGIVALAFAYVILARRAWWENVILLVAVIPIALIANSTRIVCTGLLYQYVSGEAAHKFTHDVAGWVMIPFAALLFAMTLWYLGKLVREVEMVDVSAVVRRERA